MQRLSIESLSDLDHLERLATAMWIFDVDRHQIWWANRRGLDFWRAETLEALVARDFGTDSPSVRQRLRQIVSPASGAERLEDTWTLYPGGIPAVVNLAIQPIVIEGARNGVLVEVTSIEGRVAGGGRYWRMIEATLATPLMITSLTAAGRVLGQNPAALACYGPACGQSVIETPFVDAAQARRKLHAAMANERVNWQAQVRTQTGEDVHLVSPVRSRDPVTGEFVLVLSEMRITDLARALETQVSRNSFLKEALSDHIAKLERSEARYARALETASIWEWDVEADKIHLSPNFAASIGYEPEELIRVLREETFAAIVDPRDIEACREAFSAHRAGFDAPFHIEARVLHKSGKPLWFGFQGKHYCDAAGHHVRTSGFLVDVSERKSLEEQLLSSQRLEAVGQLTGGIAHDFNNLLTVIQGNAELLLIEQVPDPDLAREIVRATRKGAELTRHLLAFARKQPLKPRRVDLHEVIPAMRNTLLRALGEDIEIRFKAAEDLCPVHVDETQLEAAVLNVALNARDAMPGGGTITIDCSNFHLQEACTEGEHELKPGHYVKLRIEDTGTGMSPETLQRSFEPFFTTKEVGRGSGLGLSMVLGFSRQSGGNCRIRSTPGQGTVVTIVVPRAPEGSEATPPSRTRGARRGRGEHVHVLEDNSSVMQAASKTLVALGYQVSESRSYDEARRFAEGGGAPAVYLLDVILPGGRSGVDFAQWLEQNRPGSRVVFMSGFPSDHLESSGGMPGDRPFLRKPFGQAELGDVIRAALEQDVK